MYYYTEQKRWLINYDNGISLLLMLKGTFKYCEIYLARGNLLHVFIKCFSVLCAAVFILPYAVSLSQGMYVVYLKHLLWSVVKPKEPLEEVQDTASNNKSQRQSRTIQVNQAWK